MITVCDRRYLEKTIHIVCWACMSLIQWGKVLLLALEYDSLLDNTKVQIKGQIEKLCFSSTFR